ncbi:MAG: transposase family protein [Candidatus Competibacteraceae bacterium]|nr:transposase family protein [Candidatus Competibacteraceae bacterium]
MVISPSIDVANALHDDRQLRALMGLGRDEFDQLLQELITSLEEDRRNPHRGKPKKRRRRKIGGGRKPALGPPENQLLFILFYLKNYPTYDVLAFTFGISRGCAFASVQRLLPVLMNAQEKLKVLPKRPTDDPEKLLQLIESVDHVLIDATERPLQRPQKPARQKKHFSGKRGFHTVKNTTVADTDKRILILGETVPGRQHDYALFKEEFDPQVDWFSSTEASVDLGYQGIQTDYSSSEHLHIPHKKPRKSKKNPDPQLTRQQKRDNRRIGRVRVLVEHAIGGMKTFRVLTIRLRNRLRHLIDGFIFAAAGLWNLKNSFVVQ